MTLRAPVDALGEGERDLEPATSRYLVRVHRSRVGDRFVAFDVAAGLEADAEVVHADPRRARVRIGPLRSAAATAPLPVTLLWALGKADKPEAVIRAATSLGVVRIVLVTTERTIVRPSERSDARRERWQSVARDAARQSGRGDLPDLVGPLPLDDALAIDAATPGVVLDPSAESTLAQVLSARAPREMLRVLIGPEGGLGPGELARARGAGLLPARFGRLVLRTETAVAAVLGALLARSDGQT